MSNVLKVLCYYYANSEHHCLIFSYANQAELNPKVSEWPRSMYRLVIMLENPYEGGEWTVDYPQLKMRINLTIPSDLTRFIYLRQVEIEYPGYIESTGCLLLPCTTWMFAVRNGTFCSDIKFLMNNTEAECFPDDSIPCAAIVLHSGIICGDIHWVTDRGEDLDDFGLLLFSNEGTYVRHMELAEQYGFSADRGFLYRAYFDVRGFNGGLPYPLSSLVNSLIANLNERNKNEVTEDYIPEEEISDFLFARRV